MRFGAFGIDDVGDICFTHATLGETLEAPTLMYSLMGVASVADDYDDKIVRAVRRPAGGRSDAPEAERVEGSRRGSKGVEERYSSRTSTPFDFLRHSSTLFDMTYDFRTEKDPLGSEGSPRRRALRHPDPPRGREFPHLRAPAAPRLRRRRHLDQALGRPGPQGRPGAWHRSWPTRSCARPTKSCRDSIATSSWSTCTRPAPAPATT